MDFVRLVENGTYKKEDLSKEQQHFVEGMEFVTDSVLECVREMIYVTMCEYIVCTLDSENVERDKDEG